ncbi:MAG: hypothetical protein NC131_10280 [Roseburia sp.]|nr:hypothetical protein [Roseburia sp.]
MKGHLDAEQLKGYSYKDLQALAKDMGVSASGKAEEIIARITAVEVDVPEESQLTEEEKAAAEAAAREEAARQEEERAAAERAAREQAEAAQAAEKAAAEQKAREEAEAAAGLVKVKAVTRFLDKQLNQIKDAGEAYSVSRGRAAELVAAGVAEIVG